MRKLGLFLLKYNIHVMTLIFLCVSVWAVIEWNELLLIQKISLGAYALLVIHEYEESYKGLFISIFSSNLGLNVASLLPGMTHISQAVAITVIFILSLAFPQLEFITFSCLILCIFEGFVHSMGSFLFRLGKPSPGWYTAILMAIYAIWAICLYNSRVDYAGIQWLWAVLFFFAWFALMQNCFLFMAGTNIFKLRKKMMSVAKRNLFGK